VLETSDLLLWTLGVSTLFHSALYHLRDVENAEVCLQLQEHGGN
jgi:hypothetical protein